MQDLISKTLLNKNPPTNGVSTSPLDVWWLCFKNYIWHLKNPASPPWVYRQTLHDGFLSVDHHVEKSVTAGQTQQGRQRSLWVQGNSWPVSYCPEPTVICVLPWKLKVGVLFDRLSFAGSNAISVKLGEILQFAQARVGTCGSIILHLWPCS